MRLLAKALQIARHEGADAPQTDAAKKVSANVLAGGPRQAPLRLVNCKDPSAAVKPTLPRFLEKSWPPDANSAAARLVQTRRGGLRALRWIGPAPAGPQDAPPPHRDHVFTLSGNPVP